jgi:hypothetical protein
LEKEEVEALVQKTQAIVHKLYKKVLEIPLVITMKEQSLKIGEVMKGFKEKIQDLELKSTPRMPPKVHKGRLKMETIIVAKIKKFEEECTKNCEESAKVWEDLMSDPKMKVVEDKLQEEQE